MNLKTISHFLVITSLLNGSIVLAQPTQTDDVATTQVKPQEVLYKSLIESESGIDFPGCGGESNQKCCVDKRKVKYFQGLQYLLEYNNSGGDKESLIALQERHDQIMAKIIMFDNLTKINIDYKDATSKLKEFEVARSSLVSESNNVIDSIDKIENMVVLDSVISEAIDDPKLIDNFLDSEINQLDTSSATLGKDYSKLVSKSFCEGEKASNSNLEFCKVLNNEDKSEKFGTILKGFFTAHKKANSSEASDDEKAAAFNNYKRILNDGIPSDLFDTSAKNKLSSDLTREFNIHKTNVRRIIGNENALINEIDKCKNITTTGQKETCIRNSISKNNYTAIAESLESFKESLVSKIDLKLTSKSLGTKAEDYINTEQTGFFRSISNFITNKEDNIDLKKDTMVNFLEKAESLTKATDQSGNTISNESLSKLVIDSFQNELTKINKRRFHNVSDENTENDTDKIKKLLGTSGNPSSSGDCALVKKIAGSINGVFDNFCSNRPSELPDDNKKEADEVCSISEPLMSAKDFNDDNKLGLTECKVDINSRKLGGLIGCLKEGFCKIDDVVIDGDKLPDLQRELAQIKQKINAIKNSPQFKALDNMKHYVANDMATSCGMQDSEFVNLSMCSNNSQKLDNVEFFIKNGNEIVGELDQDLIKNLDYDNKLITDKRRISSKMNSQCAYLDKSVELIASMCATFEDNKTADARETAGEKQMKAYKKYHFDENGRATSEKRTTGQHIGRAFAANGNNIAQTAMMGLFPPNYDHLYNQAIYSKNQAYIYDQLMNPNPQFYSSNAMPNCDIYFCANYNPYFDFNNNFAATTVGANTGLVDYNSSAFFNFSQ